jgi:hypothetical protein
MRHEDSGGVRTENIGRGSGRFCRVVVRPQQPRAAEWWEGDVWRTEHKGIIDERTPTYRPRIIRTL